MRRIEQVSEDVLRLNEGTVYTSLLRLQELMLHANITTTMNIYTKALTPAKREAQSGGVDVLLDGLEM